MQTILGEVLSELTRGLAIQSLLLAFIGVILIVASHVAPRNSEPDAPTNPEAPAQVEG
jgi:hypothetical protein